MRKHALGPALTREETVRGMLWMVVSLSLLPSALTAGNALLGTPLSGSRLNLVYYGINFAGTVLIFHRFLRQELTAALTRIPAVLWCALLGYLGYQALTELVSTGLTLLYPDYYNVNDSGLFAMLAQDPLPLAVGTVLLVPVTEETLFRGLVWRSLYDRSAVAAYLVSMLAFAGIHVLSYVGQYPSAMLLLCFVQYLPAGYCLAWCYRQSGTLLAPIAMHTAVNAVAIYYAVR